MVKITMMGAGSGFVMSVARELAASEILQDCQFVLMDINADNLTLAEQSVRGILEEKRSAIALQATLSQEEALDGADYVVSACETKRNVFWKTDLEIPERHGVCQVLGENGGPGGQIHALRNIGLYAPIAQTIEQYCPDAWLMNFTNPMSYLCTYLNRFTRVRTLGFCHQVHGSFGVIAEMLGMAPGDLQVISGGVNHFNWLIDIRRRGTSKSYMAEFFKQVRTSKYWRRKFANIPMQTFTLEILETFGVYPVGYDSHIIEYLPFFYERSEWEEKGYESFIGRLKERVQQTHTEHGGSLKRQSLLGGEFEKPPFPRDDTDPYYAEDPAGVMEALETNTPLCLDAINIVNHGSIDNLPADAVVDVPAVVIGGDVRGIHVGALPLAAMELCRRQITLHEMVARAGATGDAKLAVQALCLDPYVRSITQARRIWDDYYKEYRDYLPQFAD